MKRIAWNKGLTKSIPHPCLCGCRKFVKLHKYPRKNGGGFNYLVNDFIKGHVERGINGFDPKLNSPKNCLCGCGLETSKYGGRYRNFIKGHENIGRVSWNKGKEFSEISRKKMSLARLGKEPANKARIDHKKLYELYVLNKKTISQVSNILNISKDSIKNRLQSLGLSRTTKESCATTDFKERMRAIRIKTLSSAKAIESPNKLEKLVYDGIDKFNLEYRKQFPLLNKFVVDAFFPQRKLVLEIFGCYWHELPKIQKKDYAKRKYLEKCGYPVEEVWDYEIKKLGIDNVLKGIFNKYRLI